MQNRECSPDTDMRWRMFGWLMVSALLMSGARAQQFLPDLGRAPELIAGGDVRAPEINPNWPQLASYALPDEAPQPLLSEIKGKPFRQVDPPPRGHHWWKYPLYVAFGLPRDAVDAVFGALNYVPIVNLPVYAIYEVVPAQAFMRDPRDWHRWPGRRNARNHGMLDSESWGFFPSAHVWDFTYPSRKKAAKNRAYNETIEQKLRQRNRDIESQNLLISHRKREARLQALTAIEAGRGSEAAFRMIAYRQAYPLEEGTFAPMIVGLALDAPAGPEWMAPLLWAELNAAQPAELAQAERLLAQTATRIPDNDSITRTLMYTRLLLDDPAGALLEAMRYLDRQVNDPDRQRLMLEVALTAEDQRMAEAAWAALEPKINEAEPLTRLDLLRGRADAAREVLEPMLAARPEDPYLNYDMGAALLLQAQQSTEPRPTMELALERLERAALNAPDAMQRLRAGEALSFTRSALAQMGAQPELYGAAAE